MRRAFKALIAAFVAVVLFAGAFVAWYIFGDSAPGKPKLGAVTVTQGGPKTPVGSWHVVRGKNVYVGYRIKELFGDAVIKRDAVGRTSAVSGSMTIAGNHVTKAMIAGTVTKLTSSREARDAYVREHALDTAKYPNARFTLTKPIALPAHLTRGQKISVPASGTLLMHGVTHALTITLEARWNGPTVDVTGTAPIQLRDYGIKPPHTVIASVDDHGSLELDLRFAPGAG